MSDIKYSFYETSSGYKVTGKDNASILLAGGGTALVSNFATYANIAAAYYTKVQLQTSGQAQVNWGNLTSIPSGLVSNSHTHSNKTFLDTVIPNTLVTNLNADLLDGKHSIDFINRSEELGNRNLLLGSQKFLMAQSDQGNGASATIEGDHVKILFTNTGNIYSSFLKVSTNLVVGETYTLSMEVLSEITSSIYFYVNGTYIINNIVPITTKWTRVSHTFLKTGGNVNANSNLLLGFVNGIAGKILRYRNIKLERGTVDTGWTPAPEDQVADWDQTDATAFSFIKNKPASLPPTAHTHAINDVTGLQNALNGKVDDSQVLTNVPVGAVFTDTIYNHPSTPGNKHIPAGGAAGQILRWSADGTAVWGADNNTVYSIFTTNTPGLVPGRVGTTTTKYLREDGTWTVPPNDNTVYPIFSGTTTAGLVPARVGLTTTKYLREDGRWEIPPDNNSVYTNGTGLALSGNQFSLTSAVTTDIAKGVTAHGWGTHIGLYSLINHNHDDRYYTEAESDAKYLKVFYRTDTFGAGVNFNTLSYTDKKSITIQPVHTPNYAGQLNMPFHDYGNIITITNSDSLFDHQIAISTGGFLKFRTTYNSNTFTSTWNEVLTTTLAQQVIGIKQFKTQGTGMDSVNHFPLQAYAEGAASILPGVSFHKGGSHAGAIVLSPNTYEFRNQSGNGFLNILSLTSRAENGFIHDQYDDAEALLTSDGGVTYTGVDIVNSGGELRIRPYEITSTGNAINCAVFRHKLVYIRVTSGNTISLNDPQQGQRFVFFNVDGDGSVVEINSAAVGKLSGFTKISLYITNAGEYIFYDQGELYVGGF